LAGKATPDMGSRQAEAGKWLGQWWLLGQAPAGPELEDEYGADGGSCYHVRLRGGSRSVSLAEEGVPPSSNNETMRS